MKARLIGYTQPPEEYKDGIKSVLDLIAFCARVSNPENQYNTETAGRLLGYLARHSHWSPFELASATLEVETTRDIARQLLRHRSFTFQEFSQRYSSIDSFDESFVLREARLQDTKNRQNSIETDDAALQAWWDAQQKFVIENVSRIYREALDKGIAKEQARAILPEGNTVSRLYVQGTIRSWMHYIQLRSANGTQKEHMELAREIARAISRMYPQINEYCDYGE